MDFIEKFVHPEVKYPRGDVYKQAVHENAERIRDSRNPESIGYDCNNMESSGPHERTMNAIFLWMVLQASVLVITGASGGTLGLLNVLPFFIASINRIISGREARKQYANEQKMLAIDIRINNNVSTNPRRI